MGDWHGIVFLYSGIIEFWVTSFMNLITGFFGVPWLFFTTKQFGLCFAFLTVLFFWVPFFRC